MTAATAPDWHTLFPDLPAPVTAAATGAWSDCQGAWPLIDQIALANQARVLGQFQSAGITDSHFAPSTGYGYSDVGREKLEAVVAGAFGAEAALVRVQIASGTHAIALGLFGCLRPGDELLCVGEPYDTLQEVIAGQAGSLKEWGVTHRVLPVPDTDLPDPRSVAAALSPATRMVLLQRSRGYALRPALSISVIEAVVAAIKAERPDVIILVDNCYGEFVEAREPAHVGADLVAGSLIKNPGGGLAPSGGYLCGRGQLVENAAARLTAPGIGGHVGANLGLQRLLFQGFFLAPHVVGEALRGAIFMAALFQRLGLAVFPGPQEPRSDLIQAVVCGAAESVLAFCQAVQRHSPVDAQARPEADAMPGYSDAVVMAAGTFVQGATAEFSADAPMRPPYAVYLQGGLTREHVICAGIGVAADLVRSGFLPRG